MVTVKAWLARLGSQVFDRRKQQKRQNQGNLIRTDVQPKTLKILSLEIAKIMSRIIHLSRSLADDEVSRLRSETLRSEGIVSFVSREESVLLGLACAEKLEDLGRIADAVATLGRRCTEPGLRGFQHVYADLVLDGIGIGVLGFAPGEIDERLTGMETYVSLTADLFIEMETLKDMEATEKRMQQWRAMGGPKENVELFRQKFAWQKQQVRHLKQVSLWNQTYDNAVGLMARMVCTIYARTCFVFGPHVSGLPTVSKILIMPGTSDTNGIVPSSRTTGFPNSTNRAFRLPDQRRVRYNSGPLERISPAKSESSPRSGPVLHHVAPSPALSRADLAAFYSGPCFPPFDVIPSKQSNRSSKIHDLEADTIMESHNSQVFKGHRWLPGQKKNWMTNASASTVGSSALAVRYANVILLVQKFSEFPNMICEEARHDLYQLLPTSLRLKIKEKHVKFEMSKSPSDHDTEDVDKCREKMEDILNWLAPLAYDLVQWHSERSFDQQQFISRSNVLLVQTLYFADREKTEEALADLLVGLSFICQCEKQRTSKEDLCAPIER